VQPSNYRRSLFARSRPVLRRPAMGTMEVKIGSLQSVLPPRLNRLQGECAAWRICPRSQRLDPGGAGSAERRSSAEAVSTGMALPERWAQRFRRRGVTTSFDYRGSSQCPLPAAAGRFRGRSLVLQVTETQQVQVARGIIELPTRGFSVLLCGVAGLGPLDSITHYTLPRQDFGRRPWRPLCSWSALLSGGPGDNGGTGEGPPRSFP